jgi:hypothetical protein
VSSLISLVTLLYVITYIIVEMHNSIYNSSIVEGQVITYLSELREGLSLTY